MEEVLQRRLEELEIANDDALQSAAQTSNVERDDGGKAYATNPTHILFPNLLVTEEKSRLKAYEKAAKQWDDKGLALYHEDWPQVLQLHPYFKALLGALKLPTHTCIVCHDNDVTTDAYVGGCFAVAITEFISQRPQMEVVVPSKDDVEVKDGVATSWNDDKTYMHSVLDVQRPEGNADDEHHEYVFGWACVPCQTRTFGRLAPDTPQYFMNDVYRGALHAHFNREALPTMEAMQKRFKIVIRRLMRNVEFVPTETKFVTNSRHLLGIRDFLNPQDTESELTKQLFTERQREQQPLCAHCNRNIEEVVQEKQFDSVEGNTNFFLAAVRCLPSNLFGSRIGYSIDTVLFCTRKCRDYYAKQNNIDCALRPISPYIFKLCETLLRDRDFCVPQRLFAHSRNCALCGGPAEFECPVCLNDRFCGKCEKEDMAKFNDVYCVPYPQQYMAVT